MNKIIYVLVVTFGFCTKISFCQLSMFCQEVAEECVPELFDFAQDVIDSESGTCDQFYQLYGNPCNNNSTNGIMIQQLIIGTLDGVGNISSGPTQEPFNFYPSLAVMQGIVARSVKVCGSGWCDYVFDDSYDLMPIEEVENFVGVNGHLPGFKSEKEYTKDKAIGIEDITLKQQEKIEELFLHLIELDKKLDNLLAKK